MADHFYIAGIDRVSSVLLDGISIDQVLTYATDVCSFQTLNFQPNEGDEIIVESDTLGRLFGGIIDRVELARTVNGNTFYNVDATDYSVMLDRKLVVETYRDMTADAIFRDIVEKYCDGFTMDGVMAGAPKIEELVFDYVYPTEVFKQLCEYVGWQWQVDFYKDLMFFNAEELNRTAPIPINSDSSFRNLKHTIDTQGLRNRVYVRGGTMLSDAFLYEIKADGVVRIWTLPHKPHDITLAVGGVPKTVGIENVHAEEDYDYLMSYQEKYVKASVQTVTPAEGITLSFTYKYDIDVITTVEDIDSQTALVAVQGGDGVYEYVIKDDSLVTLDAAEAAGLNDLRMNANPKVKGSFDTEEDKPVDMYLWSGGLLRTWDDYRLPYWSEVQDSAWSSRLTKDWSEK